MAEIARERAVVQRDISEQTRANGERVYNREFGSVVRFATANRSAWSALRGGSNMSRLLGSHPSTLSLVSVWYLHTINGGVGG